jgi:hypothetical protein
VDFDQSNAGVDKNENVNATGNAGVTFVAHEDRNNNDDITEYDLDQPVQTGDNMTDNNDNNNKALGKKKLVWADILGNKNERARSRQHQEYDNGNNHNHNLENRSNSNHIAPTPTPP